MAHYLGIDVGTSAVKAVVFDEEQSILAEADAPLLTARPRAGWSEQDPEHWWAAVQSILRQFSKHSRSPLGDVRGIGLSGQMHGAVLLDAHNQPVRPAILWNDNRSSHEAEELGSKYPELAHRLGVIPMSGFTAPKLLWLARHEPDAFRVVRKIILPKDYIRLKLTGDLVTDMSDAAGTWWLDEAARDWSDEALAATGLDRSHMPSLVEGPQPSGTLHSALAREWGMSSEVVVAGGAGDVAAGAVGLGAIDPGAALISLGTSGQLFVPTRSYHPAPGTMLHTYCHAVPHRWFQMAAMLNGASCLSWASNLLKQEIGTLLANAEAVYRHPSEVLFLPYLTGERTPHNDPRARGVFFGMSPETGPIELVQAVLEGVAFSFADAKQALDTAGTTLTCAGLIGGGSRSAFWAQVLANALDIPLMRYEGSDKGPAFGAARLAKLAATGQSLEAVCAAPRASQTFYPQPELVEAYAPRIEAFRSLYRSLKPEFQKTI